MEVWLGLQFKNEHIGKDAVDICKYVQLFVPGTGQVYPVVHVKVTLLKLFLDNRVQ